MPNTSLDLVTLDVQAADCYRKLCHYQMNHCTAWYPPDGRHVNANTKISFYAIRYHPLIMIWGAGK